MSNLYRPEAPPLDVLVVALEGEVAGLDRVSGEERWRNGLKGGGYGIVGIAVEEDCAYVAAEGAQVFCLERLTGALLWSAATSAGGRSTLLVDGGRLFVAKGGYVDCFSLTGVRLWSNKLRGMGLGAIAMGFPGHVVQADGGR